MGKYVLLLLCLFTFGNSQAQLKLTSDFLAQLKNTFFISHYTFGEREVAMIPMLHVNKASFYEMTKHKIDSLRSSGYVIFYESIQTSVTDPEVLDLMQRKFRSITGVALIDNEVRKEISTKSISINTYVSQAEVDYGVREDIDYRADLNQEEMLLRYEVHFGKIVLSTCDFETPFSQKYQCRKLDTYREYYFVNEIRDRHIIAEIQNSKAPKIALVYGRMHIIDLHAQIQDAGWRYKSN